MRAATRPRRPTDGLTCAEWAQRLLPAATVLRPPGPGPFPLVMQFHGCAGLRPFQHDYAEAALSAGWAVVIVDSLKPRGLSRLSASLTVCTGLVLHGSERAADVYAIYDWARRQTWVDRRRIAASGWSHGGWTVMEALALGERAPRHCRLEGLGPRPLDGLAGAILIYPYAGFPAMTRRLGWGPATMPVYALLCGRDQVVGERDARAAFTRLERDGLAVETLYFADATHAFDDPGANDPRSVFRPDLMEQAARWYGQTLDKIAK